MFYVSMFNTKLFNDIKGFMSKNILIKSYWKHYDYLIQTYPSGLYDAKTMDGDEYALDVTHVQWTANIIRIISTVTITIERIFTPRP